MVRANEANPTGSNAARQARFKAKMREDGYYQRTIWFHKESENRGYRHGMAGNYSVFPLPEDVVDELSFLAGWARGLDDDAATKAVARMEDTLEDSK